MNERANKRMSCVIITEAEAVVVLPSSPSSELRLDGCLGGLRLP